jgi:hypothetical protein
VSTVFVCADGTLFAFEDDDAAVTAALDLAAQHARVAIDIDAAFARAGWHRALPGMVVCRRDRHLPGVACYPLTTTTALVART